MEVKVEQINIHRPSLVVKHVEEIILRRSIDESGANYLEVYII